MSTATAEAPATRAPRRISDREAILYAVGTILSPGQVTEVRALDATTAGDRYPQTLSGYFDDPEKLAAAVGTIGTARAVYFVPNPVNPALLARACNRLRPAKKDPLTSDGDVTRRRWLKIDADPVRPAGISSTDAEHGAALARAEAVARALTAAGWPGPISGDSSNGGHLLYPIDEPANDGGLIQRCLAALSDQYTDDVVKIDTTVFNPARIWKLYGTLSCKGDDTPDRPHRMSRLLYVPDVLEVVPHNLLVMLGGEAPPASEPRKHRRGNGTPQPLDVAEWIRTYGLDVTGPEDWTPQGGGRGKRWRFKTCPWNSDHTNGSAYIVQFPSGAIEAGCHHDSCQGKDWHSLRGMFEKDWQPHRGNGQRRKAGATRTSGDGIEWPSDEEQAELEQLRAEPAVDLVADPSRVVLQLTDCGNAARFVARHGPDVRFCHQRGAWLVWMRCRWEWDEVGRAVALGKRTALSVFAEAASEEDPVRRANLAKWAVASQKRERISAMLALAQPDVAVTPAQLDARPMLLNCPNGTVELASGALRPHDRGDLITKVCGASYRPGATAPTFERFLARTFRSQPALIGFVQKAIGYAATGLTSEQALFFLYGRGANGKTTLIDAVMHALGDYAAKADPDLLMARDGSAAHPCNVADLMGRRLVVCSETNEGKRFDESRLKDLVGETRLKARFMRENFFEFTATHKVFLYSNHKPVVRGTDFGFWRRMRLIPFLETIDKDEKDKDLPEKLKAEVEGILAWIVAGAVRWRREGLNTPDEVEQATRNYRDEMDSIGNFLDESCIEGENLKAYAADLYAAYTKWSNESGEHPLSQKRLGTTLAERGFVSERCGYSDRKMWRGIGLKVPSAVQSPNGAE